MFDKISKKEFFKMVLRDRLPIANMDYSIKNEGGRTEFYYTPLGTMLRVWVPKGERLNEVKMYDRTRGGFEIQNVFCGDNLVLIEDGSYIGVSSKMQIEDVIGREFLIKTDGFNIISRACMLPKKGITVDKITDLVYNLS